MNLNWHIIMPAAVLIIIFSYDGSNYKFNDKGTIPDYHNVSFAFNYLPFIGKKNAKSFACVCVPGKQYFQY